MAKIFLAHATQDKPLVRKLYADLKKRGLDPWLDEINLVPGQNWKVEIPKAIRQAKIFLACLSSQSVEKVGFVQNEFRLALSALGARPSGTIFLIPVRFDECDVPDLQVPDLGLSLRDIHWVDLWQEGGFDRLVQAIEIGLDKPREAQKAGPAENVALPLGGALDQAPPYIPDQKLSEELQETPPVKPAPEREPKGRVSPFWRKPTVVAAIVGAIGAVAAALSPWLIEKSSNGSSGRRDQVTQESPSARAPLPSVTARVDAATAEAALKLGPKDRIVVQQALTALGFDIASDGVFNANTRHAIERWQRDRSEEPTSYLRATQYERLLAEAVTALLAPAVGVRSRQLVAGLPYDALVASFRPDVVSYWKFEDNGYDSWGVQNATIIGSPELNVETIVHVDTIAEGAPADGKCIAWPGTNNNYAEAAYHPAYNTAEGSIVVTFQRDSAQNSTLVAADATSMPGGFSIEVNADGSPRAYLRRSSGEAVILAGQADAVALNKAYTLIFKWGVEGLSLDLWNEDGYLVSQVTDPSTTDGVTGMSPIRFGAWDANTSPHDGPYGRVIWLKRQISPLEEAVLARPRTIDRVSIGGNQP